MSSIRKDIVFYDGLCGLCNGTVRFLIRRDASARFVFAPLQGETAGRLLDIKALPDSLVVIAGGEGGAILTKAAACRYLAKNLSWPWPWLGFIAGAFPDSFLNSIYDFIAVRRKRYFGRHDSCPIPPASWAARFIP